MDSMILCLISCYSVFSLSQYVVCSCTLLMAICWCHLKPYSDNDLVMICLLCYLVQKLLVSRIEDESRISTGPMKMYVLLLLIISLVYFTISAFRKIT